MIRPMQDSETLSDSPSAELNAVPSACAVRYLYASHFRNYAELKVETETAPIVLFGENGAGKTNILEAVSLFMPGRGLRGAKLSEMDAHITPEGQSWNLFARIENGAGAFEVGTGRAIDSEVDKRLVRIDGKPAGSQERLSAVFSALWLTPAMGQLFLEGASERRRFLDRIVYGFDPEHASRISAYERVMADRNRLLRERRFDPYWLSALEGQLAEYAVAVAAARLEALSRIAQGAQQAHPAFPLPHAYAAGDVEAWLQEESARRVEERLKERLVASRGLDAESGRTSIGTHRTDLEVIHTGKGLPARQCSTGEQKILLLSLVLACARARALAAGSAPALLLDEVAAHLDSQRRQVLFDEIAALGAQAWLTGNDRAAFSALEGRARFLYVEHGSIQAI